MSNEQEKMEPKEIK